MGTTTFQELLTGLLDENFPTGPSISEIAKQLLGPKLHRDPVDGFFVNQGDAAISKDSLFTGGLSTCVGVSLVTAEFNFLAHADSATDPKWLADCIRTFVALSDGPIEVYRLNGHGEGLNVHAEQITRQVLENVGLMEACRDIKNEITPLHTVCILAAGTIGDRVRVVAPKLQIAEE